MPSEDAWFRPGHEVTLKHGAWSPRQVLPVAEQIAADLAERAPWTAAPAFAPAVQAWAHTEAQAVLLRSWLDEHGHLDDEGQPRAAVTLLGKVESRAGRLRSELGLTPQALGSLMTKAASVASAVRDEGVLEALRAEGAALLASRSAEGRAALSGGLGGSEGVADG
jgi:hypothetical protein